MPAEFVKFLFMTKYFMNEMICKFSFNGCLDIIDNQYLINCDWIFTKYFTYLKSTIYLTYLTNGGYF